MELYNFVNEQVDKRVNNVKNGDDDALMQYIELKRIAKALETAIKEIQADALAEAEKYGKGEFLRNGASVSVRATAVAGTLNIFQNGRKRKSKSRKSRVNIKRCIKRKNSERFQSMKKLAKFWKCQFSTLEAIQSF